MFQSAHKDRMDPSLLQRISESLVPKKSNFIQFHHPKAIPVCVCVCVWHTCKQFFKHPPFHHYSFGDQGKQHCAVTALASEREDNKENLQHQLLTSTRGACPCRTLFILLENSELGVFNALQVYCCSHLYEDLWKQHERSRQHFTTLVWCPHIASNTHTNTLTHPSHRVYSYTHTHTHT